ncbi:OBAP family protein [Lysobacter arvi]|uniref:OBAP family protein n=1 Tax=Lysobacter arvi TaxID=3038776 RepID=A0ABU1C9U8_9GAMM|nr:OBAP family protein [Lysobacter arvi]MDR0181913.1 OBAP family protein [Lysobacter arvi]
MSSLTFPVPHASKLAGACLVAALLGACGDDAPPTVPPPGEPKRARTEVLEAGAAMLQNNGPLARHDIHLVGFHPMKEAPDHQMEAHHFCRQINEDFAQCVLFDGSAPDANLTGIEYIVSERLFDTLPREERTYWHPHNAEILTGQLVAPGIPAPAEQALMRSKMNSYGKTWHTWHTRSGVQPGTALPLGPAMLAWSFNRDGEVQPGLVASRDRTLRMSTDDVRRQRQSLLPLARPQEGVDALRPHFPQSRPVPGVEQKR